MYTYIERVQRFYQDYSSSDVNKVHQHGPTNRLKGEWKPGVTGLRPGAHVGQHQPEGKGCGHVWDRHGSLFGELYIGPVSSSRPHTSLGVPENLTVAHVACAGQAQLPAASPKVALASCTRGLGASLALLSQEKQQQRKHEGPKSRL